MTELRNKIADALGPCLERAHNEHQLADACLSAIAAEGLAIVDLSVVIEEATSATNIVSHDGYYEIDTAAVEAAVRLAANRRPRP